MRTSNAGQKGGRDGKSVSNAVASQRRDYLHPPRRGVNFFTERILNALVPGFPNGTLNDTRIHSYRLSATLSQRAWRTTASSTGKFFSLSITVRMRISPRLDGAKTIERSV